MICNDPPEADLARCEIYSKLYDEATRKSELASHKPEPTKKVASFSKAKPRFSPPSRKKKKKSTASG